MQLLGIRPWEAGLLTVAQFDRCTAYVDAIEKRANDES